MKENATIRINTTTENLERIKQNAEKVGMTIKEFILWIGLNSEIEIKIKTRT